jgi:hypothetical protein
MPDGRSPYEFLQRHNLCPARQVGPQIEPGAWLVHTMALSAPLPTAEVQLILNGEPQAPDRYEATANWPQ